MPWVGAVKPSTTLNSVVLPAPFGPIKPINSPLWIQNDTFSSTVSEPYTTCKLSTSTTISLACEGDTEIGEVLVLDAKVIFSLCLIGIGESFDGVEHQCVRPGLCSYGSHKARADQTLVKDVADALRADQPA